MVEPQPGTRRATAELMHRKVSSPILRSSSLDLIRGASHCRNPDPVAKFRIPARAFVEAAGGRNGMWRESKRSQPA